MARVQASARLSSKSQVVMPKVVRERIGVGPGDLIVFEVRDDEAVVRRAPRVVQDDPFAVFTQWASPADAEAHDAFERWDVVAVPFPYVELLQTKRRPAVVVSGQRWLKAHGLPWVAMVTSAVHAPQPDDVPIRELETAGLARDLVIRSTKIATVEAGRCERLGRLAAETCRRVEAALRGGLAA